MNRLGSISVKTVIALLGAFIVIGGFGLALLSNTPTGTFGSFAAQSAPSTYPLGTNGSTNDLSASINGGSSYSGQPTPIGGTQVIQTVTEMATTTMSSSATGTGLGQSSNPAQLNSTLGTGALIEFSSDVSIQSANPQQGAAGVVALAYSVGGYVAYQSTFKDAAYVVIRVPASQYQKVLAQVEAMGNVTSLISNSNDVRVQYTDLNATLASFQTEQGALLRLLNQSTTVNSTLQIETQLQGVNQQINYIQSQILQTRTLIDFSTIDVTISKSAQTTPLSMTLSATPTNGTAPLSVTFNAIVKGGAQPYIVNYNFGDGTSYQGQILIHTFEGAGDYKVTVTATDLNGTVTMTSTKVHVEAAPNQYGAVGFPTMIANLFVNVLEGIVEVAVVVLPLAAVAAVVVFPFRRRNRSQKTIKQSQ
jgi:PKD repeat protein